MLMDKYKEEVLGMVQKGKVSYDDAQKLLRTHEKSLQPINVFKNIFNSATKDVKEKFKYLVTLELPEENVKKSTLKKNTWPCGNEKESFEISLGNIKKIDLTSYNGRLNIAPSTNEKLIIKVGYNKRSAVATVALTSHEHTISINYSTSLLESVDIEAYVPIVSKLNYNFGAMYGNIFVYGISGKEICCSTKSGHVTLQDTNFKKVLFKEI